MQDSTSTVLLVEDNPADARLIELTLEGREQFTLEWVDGLEAALSRIERGGIHVVLLDLTLPDSQGLDTFRSMKAQAADVPIVVMSGLDAEALALQAVQEGAQDYLVKRFGMDELVVRSLLYALQRHRTEQALRRAKDAAEAANRAKTQFVAVVSHEIRSPASTILGFSELLEETALDEEQRGFVQRIERAARSLAELGGDLLDLSAEEVKPERIERQSFELAPFVEDVCEAQRLRAREKRLSLVCEIDPDVPDVVSGDPARLRQVLLNLIGNAIKFTDRGEVKIEVARDVGGVPDFLRFSVSDTGIGIANDRREAIFEPFAQADPSIRQRFGGTGLGLSVAKRLVEAMDGRIWVEGEVGRGSTFRFTVHVGDDASGDAPSTCSVDLRGVRTLLVDPDPTSRAHLRRMLLARGAEVQEADGGARGLAAIRRAKTSQQPFEIVLLTSNMPGFTGFEVVQHLRDLPEISQHLVMILPQHPRDEDVRRVHALGLAGFVVRPVTEPKLQTALASARRRKEDRPARHVAVPAGPSDDGRRLRVLLAEDSEEIRTIVRRFLRQAAVDLDTVENGAQAVEQLRQGDYDLVFMDIEMPVLDGRSAATAIRRWEQERSLPETPIVALTAHAMREQIRESLAAGCSAHLAKPFTKQQLLDTVRGYRAGTPKQESVDAPERPTRSGT